MARLSILGGLGRKGPAAFLLEIEGRRILMDLGEGPAPGERPCLDKLGAVDALVLSHAHMDHCGALDLHARIGAPPVHASAATWAQIPPGRLGERHRVVVPLEGTAEVAGLAMRFGRSGHALGGVWMQIDTPRGGLLYTGDWSVESDIFPFDPPPATSTLIVDASYGDRVQALEDQFDRICAMAQGGAVLCVPAAGRGPEVALRLARAGLSPKVCPVVAREIRFLAEDLESGCVPEIRAALATFAFAPADGGTARPGDAIVATEANAEAGLAAALRTRLGEGFRFLFSSHVPAGTPAEALLRAGAAHWLGWNVHPRLEDVLDLADFCAARRVVPLFLDVSEAPKLCAGLGDRLCLDRTIEV